MTTKTAVYEASRALNDLDAARAAGEDWASYTNVLPVLQPLASDDTVPMLPALLRPQAE
jgi:hypothetical protein